MDWRLKDTIVPGGGVFRDESGGAAVEFGLLAGLLFFITFAVIEGSLAAWQWNAVEKAAALGVRQAVVSDPVAGSVRTFDCNDPAQTLVPGMSCSNPAATTFAMVTCDGGTTACSDGSFNTLAFGVIRDAMLRGYPFLQDSNIVIEYSDSKLGYVGRPDGVIPVVTVRLTGIPFNFLVLNSLAQLASGTGMPAQLLMPDITAALTGEALFLQTAAGP